MSPITFSRSSLFRLALACAILAAFHLLSTPAGAADLAVSAEPDVRDFQLLTDSSGWVLMGSGLHWTDENGIDWRDITPPGGGTIMDVVFLDDEQGRVVLSQGHPSQFALASTSDGGASWTSRTYDFSELAGLPSAVTAVHMGWRDPSLGWLVFQLATGSNFSLGLLYTTQDGGGTWKAHEIPLGEPAVFIDAQRGWVAGGPAGKLYQTQDGGQSWHEQSPSPTAYHHLPIFADDLHGTLPALIADDGVVHAELFQTGDAGQTWTSTGRIPLMADTPLDLSLPLSVDDAGGLTLLVPNTDQIVTLSAGGLTETLNADGQSADIVKLDMLSSHNGWGEWVVGECDADGKSGEGWNCRRETRLLATADGGRSWNAVRLPGGQTSILENFSAPGKADPDAPSALAFEDPDTLAYVGQGFDKCEVPTLSQMQNWWTNSPYNAVNLYIGGSARACANSALSDSYVSQMSSQGWRFIPTWVGPQASCAGYASKMSSDPEVAYNQGLLQANLASDIAADLELAGGSGSGTVIYYDLEAYNTSNTTCRNAANAFISGWVAQMRERGNLGGVYGASCSSAVSDWANIANVPDAIWIANWYDVAGAVSYRRNASVWGAACLSDSLWDDHQRLRQYAGGHNETWGGLTLNIDSNVIDGPLTVRDGTGGQSAPAQPISPGPADNSTLPRTNDTWLTWKSTGDTCSVHIWGGSLDTTINGNCFQYRLGTRPGGAYSWQVTSTNAAGSTLGPVWEFKIRPHKPSSAAVGSVAATTVNLSWQLSADDPSNLDGYRIYRNGVNVAGVGKSVSTYQVTGLACNTAYSFYVTAIRQGVESDLSNTVEATTTTCAPALTSPVDGTVLLNRRPAFDWQPVPLATSYQIQVATSASFSGVAINAKTPATDYLAPKDLAIDKIYYWRVRGIGSFGSGDWSDIRSFRTANPPSLPRISAPSNGGLVTDYSPTLNWTDSVLPADTQLDHYQIQLAADNVFASILQDKDVSNSEFTVPADLAPNSRYYWRVRAFNTLGQYTPWTSAWSFRTAILPPDPATPTDGFLLEHRRPTFDWTDVSGATRYTLQLSRNPNFAPLLTSRSSTVSKYSVAADLPGNTLLYWRVRTDAPNGPSSWSPARSFTTGNPPSTPGLRSPAQNALVTEYQPRLDWNDVQLPAGTTLDRYQIQIAADAGFGAMVFDETVSSSEFIPPAPLAANAKLYWRVRAFNTNGHYSAWSVVRYFRTAMTAPILVSPVHESALANPRPALTWQNVDGATRYTVQVSRTTKFSSNLVNASVSTPAYTAVKDLPAGVTLYWRVRALGPNGPSLWSEVNQFVIE